MPPKRKRNETNNKDVVLETGIESINQQKVANLDPCEEVSAANAESELTEEERAAMSARFKGSDTEDEDDDWQEEDENEEVEEENGEGANDAIDDYSDMFLATLLEGDNWENGAFSCQVCAAKSFKNIEAIVQHCVCVSAESSKSMTVEIRRKHLSYAKVLCNAMKWDIDRFLILLSNNNNYVDVGSEVGLDVDESDAGDVLTWEILSQFFYMPIAQAAKELHIGLTQFKRRCRKLGVRRWPRRKLMSINALIENVKEMEKDGEVDPKVIEDLEEQRKELEAKPNVEMVERTKRLRQACFKAKHEKKILSSGSSKAMEETQRPTKTLSPLRSSSSKAMEATPTSPPPAKTSASLDGSSSKAMEATPEPPSPAKALAPSRRSSSSKAMEATPALPPPAKRLAPPRPDKLPLRRGLKRMKS